MVGDQARYQGAVDCGEENGLFDIEVVFMYPWAVVYRESIKQSGLIFWSMFSFISILMVGYVYAVKKGALDWKR